MAATTTLLGTVAEYAGQLEQARRLYETSLASFEVRLGPEHPHVADVLNNLGLVAARRGDHAASRQAHARALKIRMAQHGPDNVVVAASLTGLGAAQHALGSHAEAVVSLQRALDIQVGAKADADTLAKLRFSLAEALHAKGTPRQAYNMARPAQNTLRSASQGGGEGGQGDSKLRTQIDQ